MTTVHAFEPEAPRIGPLRMLEVRDGTSSAELHYKWVITESPEARRYDAACDAQERADREYAEAAAAMKAAMDAAWAAVEADRNAM